MSIRQWRHLGAYKNADIRALEFCSRKEFERTIRLCWKDPDLDGLPRDSLDGEMLLVPKEAVALLRSKGLSFKAHKLGFSRSR